MSHTGGGNKQFYTQRGGPTFFTKGGINIFHQMGGGISIFTQGRYISKLKVGTNIFAQGTRNIRIHSKKNLIIISDFPPEVLG